MRYPIIFSFLFGIVYASTLIGQQERPNILLIVADDLGYSDIGSYGGEIATPILDKIASQSIQFSNFHTLPTCAPTRAMLLTSVDNHMAGIGAQYGLATEAQQGQPGYEGQLNFQVATLPEVLKNIGYRTYHVGKWHLGHEENYSPYKRGFQETFSLMQGGGSHYADQLPLNPDHKLVYRRNEKVIKELPADFYSTKNYTDSLLSWLVRDTFSDDPFFAYLSYTAPHDPLHAPAEYIKKYKGLYDEGYEVLHKKRFKNLQQKGFIAKDQPLPAWPSVIKRWNDLSEEEQRASARDMEVYAAMVDYMDEQIGRIYQQLEATKQLDNTVIIFLSDNGANGINPEVGYMHTEEFKAQFDNSIPNKGLPKSFAAMRAGWAVASTAAFRFFKAFSTEGGIRTPCFIKLPTTSLEGQINNAFVHVSDLMPTLLEVLKIEHPSAKNQQLKPMEGYSLLPLIEGKATAIRKGRGLGMELHGTRAYFKDEWKIIFSPMPIGSGDWELFNVQKDPAESDNLIFSNPSKYKELLGAYKDYEKESGVIYGLISIFATTKKIFDVLLGVLVAIFGLAILGKLSGKLKDKYKTWGYGIPFMYVLAIVELIGVVGLFTLYNKYAACLLLVIMVGAFFTLLKNKENWKSFLLPFFTSVLLIGFLVFKSGILVRTIL